MSVESDSDQFLECNISGVVSKERFSIQYNDRSVWMLVGKIDGPNARASSNIEDPLALSTLLNEERDTNVSHEYF